jgi:hypothetical protein
MQKWIIRHCNYNWTFGVRNCQEIPFKGLLNGFTAADMKLSKYLKIKLYVVIDSSIEFSFLSKFRMRIIGIIIDIYLLLAHIIIIHYR